MQGGSAYPSKPAITVAEARQVVNLFKQNFPNVVVITSPELGHPYLTLAHGFPGMGAMNVNGLQMNSPLFTMALYSSEVARGNDGRLHYAHAYEVMSPNIPSNDGSSSNIGTYVNSLWDSGLEVHSDHYHWKTAGLSPAVHHMGVDMSPIDFASRTINSLSQL